MYYLNNKKHHLPHIHVKYQDQEAVFSIESGEILEGELPPNKRKLVEAWIEIHKEDLFANWSLAIAGQTLFTIEPLK
jgi:hypothetical protein